MVEHLPSKCEAKFKLEQCKRKKMHLHRQKTGLQIPMSVNECNGLS
jgi:hypothetical protein